MLRTLIGALAASGILLTAAPANAAPAVSAQAGAAAVSHVEFNLDTVLSGQPTRLVMTATSPTPGAKVGFKFDNNDTNAQFQFVREPDSFTGRYILRSTENTANPLCLDVLNLNVVVDTCDGTSSQLWKYSSASGIKLLEGRKAFLPAGSPLLTTLIAKNDQSTRMTRLFVN